MSIRIFGSLGVGLSSKYCSICACDCTQACNCSSEPTAIRFWMAAPETEISPYYTCSSCPYSAPFEVTLDAELCTSWIRENNLVAMHWLFRDLDSFCDVGTPDEGTPYNHCFDVCGPQTPHCNVACFTGTFTTSCYSCVYTGLPEEQGNLPDAVSIVYEYDFRALLGTIGTHEGTPICGLVCVYFVKVYVAPNATCTDLILSSVERHAFSVATSGSCCGTTTDNIEIIPSILYQAGCGSDPDVDFPYLGNIFGTVLPCKPYEIFPPPPGEGYKRKLVIDCM